MPEIELTLELLNESQIPQRFWPLGFQTYEGNPDALSAVLRFIKRSRVARSAGVGIFLTGHPQSFKTFLGTFILKCVMHRGFSARYTTLSDVSQEYFGEGETNHTMRQLYGAVDFVFIDDLRGAPHKGEVSSLLRVLQIRAKNNLPTVLASTLPMAEMSEHFTDDVAVLLQSMKEVNCASESATFAVHQIREKEKSKIWGDLC